MKNGTVIDYTKKPLGTVTRRAWGARTGRPVEWVARCPKCGRRGARSSFIPDPKVARKQMKAHVSVTHSGHIVDIYVRFFSVDDHCTILITAENADDLLNTEELAELAAWNGSQNPDLGEQK